MASLAMACQWILPFDSSRGDGGAADAAGDGFIAQRDALFVGDSSVDGGVSGVDAAAQSDGTVADARVVPDGWVWIRPGSFTMGSPESELVRESETETLHQVTLTHWFLMHATEVTKAEYERAMGPHAAASTACDNCPIPYVTWHQAAAYCNKLSLGEGLETCYSCSGSGSGLSCSDSTMYSGGRIYLCRGYRLPTDAEWEYAYRAKSDTAYYNGGVDFVQTSSCVASAAATEIAWYCDTAGGVTHAVAGKKPNDWGLYDMAGNVLEWCHDWFVADLQTGAVQDPWGPASGTVRVVRGGGYLSKAERVRAAARAKAPPATPGPHIGFRCVRTND